jgi:hypothetical protein
MPADARRLGLYRAEFFCIPIKNAAKERKTVYLGNGVKIPPNQKRALASQHARSHRC